MKQAFTKSNSWLFLLVAAVFVVIVWQAATLPLTAAEADVWYRFVRPKLASFFLAPGAWSGLLYGLLAKRTIGLFRLSEFSLRLPGVLAGGVYLASFVKLASFRKTDMAPVGKLGSFRKIIRYRWLLLPLAVVPVWTHWFSFAGGLGLALGFCALAFCYSRFAALWLGLALAAAPQFGFVPLILAAAFLAAWGFWRGMERVVIPAVTVAFILLLIPLSHGGSPVASDSHSSPADFAVRSAVGILRRETATSPVRIAAGPSAEASLAFYRERYRRRNWLLDARDPQYFLWIGASPPAVSPDRTILFQQAGVVLAR